MYDWMSADITGTIAESMIDWVNADISGECLNESMIDWVNTNHYVLDQRETLNGMINDDLMV